MGSLKKDFPRIPLIALTATANDRVKQDVMVNLGMKSPLVLSQSFNRKNLKYEVRPKTKTILADIATFISGSFRGKCGIIYCQSKKQCEDTADKLRKDYKIRAAHYHAVRFPSFLSGAPHLLISGPGTIGHGQGRSSPHSGWLADGRLPRHLRDDRVPLRLAVELRSIN
jgi:hypothetical protein